MKKQVSFTAQGQRADIGHHTIYRMLPNRYADAVGPFVFLDYIPPAKHDSTTPIQKGGVGAHPHRGIATLTYILSGEGEHFDSRGHYAKVSSGGAQWMKAGNGIIHDENMNPDPKTGEGITHGFQFWINLPAKNKAENPDYMAVQASDMPMQQLSDNRGWLKVIVGEYEGLAAKVPMYSKQFLYHIHLVGGKQFTIDTEDKLEYAAFLPQHNVIINGDTHDAGDFIEFDRKGGTLDISNPSPAPADIILFGGEAYTEPIVAEGPFVMNSHMEIGQAYRDFYAGKYGEVKYDAGK